MNGVLMMAAAAFVVFGGGVSAQTVGEPTSGPNYVSGIGVKLRAMDKLTARTRVIDAYVSETTRFGTLRIEPLACRASAPLDPPEAKAYLRIRAVPLDAESEAIGDTVFAGWMFASDPAANPLQHAVYDVWPIACITASPDKAGGPPAQSPTP